MKRYFFLLATILFIFLTALLASFESNGQYRYRRSSGSFYFGLEANMGTKSYLVKSNISAIDGTKGTLEGFSFGALAGSRTVVSKVRFGSYDPSTSMKQKNTLKNTEFGVNVFPLEIFGTKNKFFRPYALLGIERNTFTFFGNYALPQPPAPSRPMNGPPVCPLEEQEQEYVPTPEQSTPPVHTTRELPEGSKLGVLNVVRGSVGAGLTVHVAGKRSFMNFYMEAVYGSPLKTRATSPAFDNTSTESMITMSAGVAFGLKR